MTWDLTKITHVWPLQTLKQVTSSKMLLFRQPNTCHWLMCKGQANHGILLKIATTLKLVEFVTNHLHRNNIATEMWHINKFSNGCDFMHNEAIFLPFTQKSETSVRLPVELHFWWCLLFQCLERPPSEPLVLVLKTCPGGLGLQDVCRRFWRRFGVSRTS